MSETQSIENKQSLNEWKQVVKSVAAFATSTGGLVYIGIDPHGKRHGVEIGKGTLEDLANKIKINTEPPQFPSIKYEGKEKSAVITIKVEESPIKHVWAFGSPFKRVGRTNQRLSREEAHRLMEMSTGRSWDALPCSGFELDHISDVYVGDFILRTGLGKTVLEDLLKNLALLTNQNTLCNAAALLFAFNPQRFFPEAQVKCARFAGKTSIEFIDEQTLDGGLISQLERALAFIKRNTRQAIRISGKAERDVVPEYPEEAIREAIVNAICHRDYAATGTVQIRIYDDRLEVWNPGMLPPDLSIEDLKSEHPSRPKNPKIAHVFHRARLIENWGTGTLRIIRECEGTEVKPEFVAEMGVFKVRFVKKVEPEPVIDELELSPRQKKALEFVREHGQITNREYQELFGLKRRQALRDLKELVELGMLYQAGVRKTTRYIIRKKE
ncbi:MAG: putative DNA binding domain-containing protein [Gemmatimonadota bacterium]|nr:MAG: putative DNA binding domain-containing protein [Gemmatimonadota bacterium]